jgi:hypothetical protein
MLPWTKNHRIRTTKSENDDKSSTSGPKSSLQSIHLALAPNTVMCNDERQQHIEK